MLLGKSLGNGRSGPQFRHRNTPLFDDHHVSRSHLVDNGARPVVQLPHVQPSHVTHCSTFPTSPTQASRFRAATVTERLSQFRCAAEQELRSRPPLHFVPHPSPRCYNSHLPADDSAIPSARSIAPTPAPCSSTSKTAMAAACAAIPSIPSRADSSAAKSPAISSASTRPTACSIRQRRTGAKGEGRFARITWDEALDEIAARLQVHRRRIRPRSHPALQLRRHHGLPARLRHGPPLLPSPGRVAARPHHLFRRRRRRSHRRHWVQSTAPSPSSSATRN